MAEEKNTSISDKSSSSEEQKKSRKIDIDKNKEVKKEIKKPHSRHNPKKEKQVKALAEKIKKAKTLMIVSIKGLPSKQFQDIKKSIRGEALVQVAKKNIILKAIKTVGKPSILDLQKQVQENCAFVISDMEGYELAGILAIKKTPVNAKAGQIANEDIEVKPGPTDLVPGPAISELGSLGLQVSVENGKISIKAAKVIVNKGQEINQNAASILQKLNIQPFSVGLEPIAIYDVENEKIYTDIKIDSEETASELASAAGKALGFAQKIIYYCKETIGYLLVKANSEQESLSKLQPVEEKKKEVSEEKKEGKKEETTDSVKEEQAKQEVAEAKQVEGSSEKPITDMDKTQTKSGEEK